MIVLLDTNIILEHLRSGILTDLPSNTALAASVITEAELFRYPGIGIPEVLVIEKFLKAVTVVNVDSAIARRAASLGRTRKTKLPDLLIAATAIELGATLITKNIRDYRGIPELNIQTTP